MAGVQKHSIGSNPLQQVRLQSFLKHAESNAASDIRSQGASDARLDVALQWKKAAAESGIAAGTMRHGCAARSQPIQFGIGGMNIMRHHSALAVEPEPLVHRQVIGSPWKEARDVRNLL